MAGIGFPGGIHSVRILLGGFVVCLTPLAPGQTSTPPATAPVTAPAAESSGNLQYYLKHTYGPGAIVRSAFWSGVAQWRDYPTEWGQGADGYGRRLGSAQGRRIIKNTVDFGFASLRGEVLDYSRCECKGFWPRTKHALKYTFVRRAEDGGTTLALGRFAGAYASGLASNLWYPDSRNGLGDGLERGSLSIGWDAGNNVFREFWPDVKKRFSRR